jgi:hypothetical protein
MKIAAMGRREHSKHRCAVHPSWRTCALVAALAAIPVAGAGPASAHDDAPETHAIFVAPRAEIRIGNQEAVVLYIDRKLMVFLQRYVDGVPTTGAKLQATADFIPGDLDEVAPGVYSGDSWTLAGGRNEIELDYTIAGKSGQVNVPLIISANANQTPGQLPILKGKIAAGAVPGFVLALAALCTYAVVNLLFLRRSRRARRIASGAGAAAG